MPQQLPLAASQLLPAPPSSVEQPLIPIACSPSAQGRSQKGPSVPPAHTPALPGCPPPPAGAAGPRASSLGHQASRQALGVQDSVPPLSATHTLPGQPSYQGTLLGARRRACHTAVIPPRLHPEQCVAQRTGLCSHRALHECPPSPALNRPSIYGTHARVRAHTHPSPHSQAEPEPYGQITRAALIAIRAQLGTPQSHQAPAGRATPTAGPPTSPHSQIL